MKQKYQNKINDYHKAMTKFTPEEPLLLNEFNNATPIKSTKPEGTLTGLLPPIHTPSPTKKPQKSSAMNSTLNHPNPLSTIEWYIASSSQVKLYYYISSYIISY